MFEGLSKYKINHPVIFFFVLGCIVLVIHDYGVQDGTMYIIDFCLGIFLYKFIAGIRD